MDKTCQNCKYFGTFENGMYGSEGLCCNEDSEEKWVTIGDTCLYFESYENDD